MKEKIKSSEIKTARTGLVSTETEAAIWAEAARKDGLSLSAFLRRAANKAAAELGVCLPAPDGGHPVPIITKDEA